MQNISEILLPSEGLSVPDEPNRSPQTGHGPLRILLTAVLAAALIGCAGFAVSQTLPADRTLPQTMCADASCAYALSADGSRPLEAAPAHKPRSTAERFAHDVLYFCHLR